MDILNVSFVLGKVSGEALTEEEQLNDLLLLIKLLTNLLSKDILDFSSGSKRGSLNSTVRVGVLWEAVPYI